MNKMDEVGDRAVVHGLRGQPANRRTSEDVVKHCLKALQKPECHDFGPTFAAKYLKDTLDVALRSRYRAASGWWLPACGCAAKENGGGAPVAATPKLLR